MMKLRAVAALAVAALSLAGAAAQAEDYPSRPVRVIVGFTPATGSSSMMRRGRAIIAAPICSSLRWP